VTIPELDARLKILLPETYRETYESMQPAPMRSAPLVFDPDGRVAWDRIWGSFCDLAMAGGPPHKGALLGPGDPAAIESQAGLHDDVVRELCRGIEMVTMMPCEAAPAPGWVRVECSSAPMAAWLLRAITMENVAARANGVWLELPASPGFRLEREIKNVITVIAKTSHYWLEHMSLGQQRAVAALFETMARERPLIEIEWPDAPRTMAAVDADSLVQHLTRRTGMPAHVSSSPGWIGLECPTVAATVWAMRAMAATNVLSRREDRVLLLPFNRATDPTGAHVSAAASEVIDLAKARGVM
jgi:hypothetical protein